MIRLTTGVSHRVAQVLKAARPGVKMTLSGVVPYADYTNKGLVRFFHEGNDISAWSIRMCSEVLRS